MNKLFFALLTAYAAANVQQPCLTGESTLAEWSQAEPECRSSISANMARVLLPELTKEDRVLVLYAWSPSECVSEVAKHEASLGQTVSEVAAGCRLIVQSQ